jgi:hypothetical protein
MLCVLVCAVWQVFDSNKKYLGCGDAWPDAVKVAKGENTIRMQIRHDEVTVLQVTALTGPLTGVSVADPQEAIPITDAHGADV